ncbi:MAG: hypothetical protein Q8P99_02675 [bacterium]|nr:hypothetical protein [bacterium]MDZ4231584.1 hypothetical protein [Patescibacteria group bacterium]
MEKSKKVKIVVFVPESHADAVREAIGKAGGGRLGKYSYCSFTTKGIGRFKPEKGAHPAIGKVGKLEAVLEERIEIVCDREFLNDVVRAIRGAHIYEEVAMDVYPLDTL